MAVPEKKATKSMTINRGKRSQLSRALRYALRRPDKLFLLIVTLTGPFLIATIPPFSGYDEANHFYRVYQISQGGIVSEAGKRGDYKVAGGNLPKSLGLAVYDLAVKNSHSNGKYASLETGKLSTDWHRKLNPDDKMFLEFSNSALYSPVAYAPYVAASSISRLLEFSPLLMLYVMRIVGYLAWAALVYFAIKLLPKGKWLVVLVALLPSTIFQAATVSTDGVTIGLTVFVIALITHYLTAKEKLTYREVLTLAGVFTLLSLLKPPYSLLVLLTLLFWQQIDGIVRRAWTFGLLFSAALVPQILWLHMIRNINFPYRNIAYNLQLNIDSHQQIAWIISHPFAYILTLLRSIAHINYLPINVTKPDFLTGLVGIIFFTALVLLALRYSGPSSPKELTLTKNQALGYALIFVIGCIVLLSSVYIAWVPVGAPLVDDFRSRYILPLLPLLLLAMTSLPIKVKDRSRLIEKLAIGLVLISPLLIISYFTIP